MANKWKYLFLSIGVIVSGGCLLIWLMFTSITLDDYFLLHQIEDESDLAIAFTVALRKNDPAAYEMVDAALTPRLDKWMELHQVPKCTRRTQDILSMGAGEGIGVMYSCRTRDGGGFRLVTEIVIEDMKVIDWHIVGGSYLFTPD